jgi:LPS-assembly protein
VKFISARFLLLPTLASPLALGLAGAVLCGMPVGTVWAQARVDGPVLTLRSSPLLEEAVSDRQKKEAPTFVQAQQLTVRPDLDVQLQGQATIRRPGLSIRADRLDYDQTQDEVKASGDVRVSRDGPANGQFSGPVDATAL